MMVDVFCGVLSGSAFGTNIERWQVREDDTRIADLVMICLSFLVSGFQRGLGSRALGLWLDQFQARPSPPPGNFWGICLLISKCWEMPHGGGSLGVQISHGGASERVQMANLRKVIKLMCFYRFYNS